MADRKRAIGAQTDGAALRTEIARIRTLTIDDLRAHWRKTFRKEVPEALTKDLIARMLIWHVQAQAFGGHDRVTLKTLESYAKGRPLAARAVRHLGPGTELVREYKGERHTVTAMSDGFAWRGATYQSLTTIAREITGTKWNGPRFFGLRTGDGARPSSPPSVHPAKGSPRQQRATGSEDRT